MMFFLCFSMVVLALLPLGYFGRIGVSVTDTWAPGKVPALRRTVISFDGGRMTCWIDTDTRPAGHSSVGGRSFMRARWRPRLPDIKHALVGFDSHSLPVNIGGSLYLFAFPMWCIALPFLIAPTIYLRRRLKKRPEPAGFAVVEIAK
jgi:hypothetical protein